MLCQHFYAEFNVLYSGNKAFFFSSSASVGGALRRQLLGLLWISRNCAVLRSRMYDGAALLCTRLQSITYIHKLTKGSRFFNLNEIVCFFNFYRLKTFLRILFRYITYISFDLLELVWSCGFTLIKSNIKKLQLKTDWKRMSLCKWQCYDQFWLFFWHMYVDLSQNWGSDGHYDILNWSKFQ